MPTYQYACSDCGHELEAVQSFTDDPLTECPECGGTLRKRFGNVGVVFKGSGFHRTDSRAINSRGASADSREGVVSFLEKRPPVFPVKVSDGLPEVFPDWDEPAFS